MTKETKDKWSGTACHTLEAFGDFIRHELHEWLLLAASLVILYITSDAFIIEARDRNITPWEWVLYPMGAVFAIIPTTVIVAIKAVRGKGSVTIASPTPATEEPEAGGDPLPPGGN